MFETFVKNILLSDFLGFLLIFVVVLVAGAILGHLVTKAMIGPLALVNRLFGGVFGFLKAVLICGILVFAMVSFEIAKPAVETSVVAPVCLAVTRAVGQHDPQDLRAKFNSSYKQIRESGGKNWKKDLASFNLHQRMELIVKGHGGQGHQLSRTPSANSRRSSSNRRPASTRGTRPRWPRPLGIHRNTLHNRAKALKIRKRY